MVLHADWNKEKAWLEYVLDTVVRRLEDVRRLAGEHTDRAKEQRRSLWEEGPRNITSFEDWISLAQASEHMGQGERSVAFYQAQIRQLQRMAGSPYFGRLDFQENGSDVVEPIYIGIGGLQDEIKGELVVFDWRAPICSLFYDAEPGPVTYDCQAGSISGRMLLKRQYRIANGKLEFMFDTDLKIDDEILQELLGRTIDEKMRTIVTSIQREQNRVIRDSRHNLLVVQGPAGSGKTAIALHRAAYLLYRYRDSINASNIVIFSPNYVFSDYISAVLPELGEENITQTTFHEYAEKQLGSMFPVESMYSQLESLLIAPVGKKREARTASTQVKSSPFFHALLKRYVTYLEAGKGTTFFEVAVRGKAVMTRQEMMELFARHHDWPFAKRLEKIRQRALYLLEPLEKQRLKQWKETLAAAPDTMLDWEIRQESKRRTREEFAPIKNRLAAWAHFDVLETYRRLFANHHLLLDLLSGEVPPQWDAICTYTLAALASGTIPYEDATPLLYLKRVLTGEPMLHTVRHVIVDEAQDYTPLQYELFNLVFPRCSMTIMGDLNQSVHPYMHISSYDAVISALQRERATLVQLSKSYRSTYQIMAFAHNLLATHDDVEVIRREGVKPCLVQVANQDELINAIIQDILALQQKGMPSVAVITKTAMESERLYRHVKERIPIRLMRANDTQFHTGTVMLPAYLAKGLEFDAVILTDVSQKTYSQENERGLLYTACTRALHELHLYYSGDVSPMIAAVDAALLEKVT